MSALFHKINWSSRVAVTAFRWLYCRESHPGMTDFAAYRLFQIMSTHADALITAPDKTMPDTPVLAAQVFHDLEKRLAPWLPDAPPLTEDDHQNLVDGAEYDALPENHLHESGRWYVTPRTDWIWDRVRSRIENDDSDIVSAAEKKRLARNAKHLEAMRERQERKRMKEWEP
jgi:hypothetical protein